MNKKTTTFLSTICIFAASYGNTSTGKPNIVFILADDLGYGDLSCFGSKQIETPNLDSLAKDGIRLTQYYAASAVCSPSRASILTGNYPLRYDIRQYFPNDEYLTDKAVTLPKMLKQQGYVSAHLGKWHLGGLHLSHLKARMEKAENVFPGPLEHGFDHYFATIEGGLDIDLMATRRMYRDGGKYLVANDTLLAANPIYFTDILGNEAIRLINDYSKGNRPFFINLWFKAPHTPYEPAPEPHYSKYKELNHPEREGHNFHRGHNQPGDGILYNSMVSHLDEVIGRIINRLKELDLYENTIIVFTSDNGPSYRGFPDPWKGGKADLHEGGIRVPMIAFWAKHFPAGKTSSEVVHSNDIFPTFCEAAGISADRYKVDGLSMLRHFETLEPLQEERTLFWQLDLAVDPWKNVWYPQPGEKPQPYSTSVVRKGDWKLLADSLNPVILYNLKVDSLESQNLLGQYPEKARAMATELENYFREERMQYRPPVSPK